MSDRTACVIARLSRGWPSDHHCRRCPSPASSVGGGWSVTTTTHPRGPPTSPAKCNARSGSAPGDWHRHCSSAATTSAVRSPPSSAASTTATRAPRCSSSSATTASNAASRADGDPAPGPRASIDSESSSTTTTGGITPRSTRGPVAANTSSATASNSSSSSSGVCHFSHRFPPAFASRCCAHSIRLDTTTRRCRLRR